MIRKTSVGLLFLYSLCTVSAQNFYGQGIRDAFSEFDLLGAIGIPPDDGVKFVDGMDGFPAFFIKSDADIKSPHRLVLPEKLYEFAIMAIIRPETRTGGYIFSVVNPLDTVVQLGMHISPVIKDKWNVTLYYTDTSVHSTSQKLISYEMAYAKKWTKMALRVLSNKITIFLNCIEVETFTVKREPIELIFDSASTLYLAQAGPILKGNFEGAFQFLKLYGYPDVIPTLCNRTNTNSEPVTDDEVGSGIFYSENGFDEFTTDDDDEFLPPPMSPPPIDRAYGSYKGEKGDRGPKGPPGETIRGPPGPPGPPGPGIGSETSNESSKKIYSGGGDCTCNATTILNLLKRDIEFGESIRGPPGKDGKEGKAGVAGLTGATGATGERGLPGPKGDRGERGDTGARGPEGLQGNKGEPGLDGTPGLPGSPGPPGSPGIPENYDESLMPNTMTGRGGSPGSKGELGDKGDKGQIGERGLPGTKGERGDAMTGAKGDRGHTGPHGPSGGKGEPGQPGLPGLPGQIGPMGTKGDVGPPGPGFNGFSSNSKNVSECMCPAGPPGSKGEMGANGLIGSPGPAGMQGERGEKGIKGLAGVKGDRGLEGPPGPATLIGDGGSPTKGEKGERGQRGRRGKTGAPGPMGPSGIAGSMGDIGLPGWPGRPGIPGPKGDFGQKGQKGEVAVVEGPKGDKGDSSGGGQYIPVPGPPGPPGPPGISMMGQKGEPGMDSRSPFYGDLMHSAGRVGSGKSSLDELKALRELKHLKEVEDSTFGPAGPPGSPGPAGPAGRVYEDSSYGSLPTNGKIVPGAVTFQNTEAMTKMSALSPVGTIAYIIDEEALLVRVNKGWQYIALGTLLPVTTPSPPTTIAPPPRPDLEASNLMNNVPYPVDGPNWYPKMLRMAALNEPYSGDLQGIRGADFACYRQARRAGLLGTFKAFLSARVQNLDSIVRQNDRDLPVVNTKGDVLFNSWKGVFNGQGGLFSQAPRIYSFSGKNILNDNTWPQKLVWHGSRANGERAMDTYCDAWHSASTDKVGLASSLMGNKLLDQERYSCDNRFAVLCIEALSQDRRKKRDLQSFDDEFESEEDYETYLRTL